ncbi:hypothetical protein ASF82_11875 [Frigoribacterium sp. Leaf164]|nr:hypothetical protein ASF82_11875 [Frigoribacterium sp. Leaf164]
MVTRASVDRPDDPSLRRSVAIVRVAVAWNLVLGVIVILTTRFRMVMAETAGEDPLAQVTLGVLPSMVLGLLFVVGNAWQTAVLVRYVRRPARHIHVLRPYLSALGWVLSTAPSIAISHVFSAAGPGPDLLTTLVKGTIWVSLVLAVVIIATSHLLHGVSDSAHPDSPPEGAPA